MSQLRSAIACPGCSAAGKPVTAVTLQALLTPAALATLPRRDGWRHCPAAGCATVYYHPDSGDVVAASGVTVRVGTKETAAPRPLCYCFGKTAEDIEAEVTRTGASTIGDRITEQCRLGLERCAETNPQGSCCLGNIRAAERRALQGATVPVVDCCASRGKRGDRTGIWASVGAMGSAVLSSACCWLPPVLVVFGVSAGGVAGFLDAYRPWLLAGAAVLLGLAFRLTYRRVSEARLVSLNMGLLWIATAVVIGFAAFPGHVARIVGSSTSPAGVAAPACCEDIGARPGRSDR